MTIIVIVIIVIIVIIIIIIALNMCNTEFFFSIDPTNYRVQCTRSIAVTPTLFRKSAPSGRSSGGQ